MTVCPWTGSGEDIQFVLDRYREAIDWITETRMDCLLSVKVPAFDYNYAHLTDLARRASRGNVTLHIDSHGPETADRTFRMAEETRKQYEHVGCTLPSRWHRSLEDVERVRELGMGVRLVKGQWPDPTHSRIDFRKNYLEIARRLAGKPIRVSIATHDSALAGQALRLLKDTGTKCELELLFSLPLRGIRIAQSLGVPVRIYTPYGYPGLPYSITQIRARPELVLWAMKNFVFGRPHSLPKSSYESSSSARISP